MGSILLLIAILLSIAYYTFLLGISPMPSSKNVGHKIISLLKKSPPKNIYELGSGWGSLAFPIAKHFPHIRVYAIELSFIPYLFSIIRKFLFPRPNLRIIRKDFFKYPLNNADTIVCYLCPKLMEKLSRKIDPNTRVITNTFSLPTRTPTKTLTTQDLFRSKVYDYQ